jgi:hypothetical protein
LLGEALALWAEWDELLEQAWKRGSAGMPWGRRAARVAEDEDQARMERYLVAWWRWFDRQAV